MHRSKFARLFLPLAAILALALFAVACGGDDDDDDAPAATSAPTAAATTAGTTAAASVAPPATPAKAATLRLGYFANVTHAQALIEVADGSLATELGTNVKLETKIFNAGPAAIEAMFAGELDATYIGPNPAINAFIQSKGEAIRIVSGTASAGALFVVRSDRNINGPADLANKKFATPQLGNTQDVALRAYLKANNLKTKDDGGNVTILPTANADTLTLFQKGDIDGAWVPEPWATRLLLEAGGKVLVDERTLWPNGDFVTTHLIVSTKYLKDHPDVVEALVRANAKTTQYIEKNPEQAKAAVNKAITDLTGKGLTQATIDGAWKNLRFTYDPIASSLTKSAQDAYDAGLLRDKPDLKGIYSLDILNKVLVQLSLPAVKE
ncbi:hypothetical protein AYO38_08150 [bacterium SCGC AG-212-C10]|nr:hypothetical protein AYO38_08150 [bacterium SCGC AG-212-C10]